MVQCAALNCTVKSGQGLSMYLFPKEPHLRKIWTVKLKRDNFVPSDYTKLCERHFEKSQFVMNPDVAASVGLQPKSKMLVNGAIPTLFDLSDPKDKHGKRSLTQTQTSKPSRKSSVIEKRRRLEVISEVMSQTMCSSIPHEAVPIEHESGSVQSDKPESQKTDANTQDIDSCSKMIQTTYNLVKRRHVGVQTTIELPPVPYVKTVTRAVQTDESNLENNLDSSFMSLCDDDLTEDPDWNPEDEEDEGPEKLEDQLEVNAAKERKFIVYESCLDKLFKICSICNSACTSTKIVHGSYLKIKNWCENCNNMNTWESQPTSKSMPLGNLVLAGAVLFSGNSAHKFLTLCQHAAIQMFSIGTYNTIQKLYLVPTVESVWQLKQLELLDAARASGEPLRLGGDGGCCSPGHTAKYLSYTLMDLNTNKIVDTQLVQKNEVKNSYAMELEGLKRGLAKLQEEQIAISHLITDRHSQIKKYMRETHPNITHWFDCWHIAKGIYKKLEAIGKKKKCEVVGQWARSISNHTYWCAMSSGGNGELVVQKWCSILNHVCNVHEGHGPLFPKCEHGDVENRVWIKQGTKTYQELEKVVRGRLLMVDIKKISPAEQTSGLEAFHNVLCHFAPKLLHFFHAQMDARVKMSALHFNENSNRQQATNQNGQPIYTVSAAKNRRGDGVAKEVKVKQTFDSEQNLRLQRLAKVLNDQVQKRNLTDKRAEQVEIIYQREGNGRVIEIIYQREKNGHLDDHALRLQDKFPSNQSNEQGVKEMESTADKISDDPTMEILKLLHANADKIKQETDIPLTIVDFAGQFAFYTTHQTFLTDRAVYLLVSDISKQVTDPVTDDCYFDTEGIKLCKVYELVEVWLNSIHSCTPSPGAKTPPVILVGTHVDQIQQDSRQEVCKRYFRQIRYEYLGRKPTIVHLADEDFAIDNTLIDQKLDELKQKIIQLASEQPYWGQAIPVRWLTLEEHLMILKAAGVKVIPYSLLEDMNQKEAVKIESREELDLFLKFQHDIGNILYFGTEGLKEQIMLDPQWLIYSLRTIITAEDFILKKIKTPDIIQKWREFKKTGKLTQDLIDAIWTKENNPECHDNKGLIIRLMEKLNIIARPWSFSKDGDEVKEENYFLAPCMLQQKTPEEVICPKPNDHSESSSVLCYVFTGNFLPSPIFHRLVAACIAHWPVAKKKTEMIEENLIFCGCCMFQLDEHHKLTLHFREHVIFLRVTRMGIKEKTPSSKLCIEVRKLVTTNLNNIIGYLGQSLKFEYFIQCPEYNGVSINSLIPVSRLQDNEEVHCDFHDNIIESCIILKFWFEDQEQSGNCVACTDRPKIRLSGEQEELGAKRTKETHSIQQGAHKSQELLGSVEIKQFVTAEASTQTEQGVVKDQESQGQDDADAPITQEHINHARLCNALTTVCANALRNILLTNVPAPHTDIYQTILANKANLKRLNKDQYQLVFPDPQGLSTGKVEEFDISLLYAIIRNVSSVPAPSNGWGNSPADNPRDTTLGASVERIRSHRNSISGHSVDGKISQQEFEDYWVKIDEVLREIEIVIGNHGYLEDLEKRKNQTITPHEARELQKKFQEYKKQTEAAADDIQSELDNVKSVFERFQSIVKILKK